ncbi:MAG: sugar transferase, partial [Cyanobacteria bacterium J055]
MTANSQLISGKGIWAFFKRCLELLKLRVRRWSLTVARTDGRVIKRIFDIVFSSFVLIFFSPVYLGLTLLIFLSSPGPVFYVQ